MVSERYPLTKIAYGRSDREAERPPRGLTALGSKIEGVVARERVIENKEVIV